MMNVNAQEELEKLVAGFKDDLQSKRVEKQELHTKLQQLQVPEHTPVNVHIEQAENPSLYRH